MYSLLDFFLDPILRAPTWGCIFMCIASSLMGTLVFLRKKSLLSESLSHATYPGACLGVCFFAFFLPQYEEWTFVGVLVGAFVSSLLGLKAINWLELTLKIKPDAALCFVLATFFGMGIVIATVMQATVPVWHKQTQMLLFGQAATMSDMHIWIYGSLAALVAVFVLFAFRPLQSLLFDASFAKAIKVPVAKIEQIVFWLLLLSLIVGIRSVGVVLMSGMVIAPAVAARQYSDRLQFLFVLAAIFGALSGFMGNYLSVFYNLPTGPMIVLVGTCIALFSLLLAPKRGLVFRFLRILSFRIRCLEENILKGIWKRGVVTETPSWRLSFVLWRLRKGGWINAQQELTKDGREKAASIVRLHRLWELYLTDRLGVQIENVHRTAEEMEHILTREMEEKLTRLLENPKHDPHDQPIPERGL
jgi:manganese/zinc/iron transport system permease protein